jgi:hypothetical protein
MPYRESKTTDVRRALRATYYLGRSRTTEVTALTLTTPPISCLRAIFKSSSDARSNLYGTLQSKTKDWVRRPAIFIIFITSLIIQKNEN